MIGQKILIAPLDWGLGHATRCIPIIRELLKRGCQVEIASSGSAGKLLMQEFPTLTHLVIPGYDISYPKKGKRFLLKMIFQLPRILYTIKKEHRWLKEKHEDHQWDLIISDNRYGLWHQQVKTILIIHQLHILSGWGNSIDRMIQELHYKWIQRFTFCWVPDQEQKPFLAGILSHPKKLPDNTRYIGILSRLNAVEKTEEKKIVVALSGPEPQRSILEKKLVTLFSRQNWGNQQIDFLRGLPDDAQIPAAPLNIRFVNHLNSVEFESIISSAALVICRSGYSSVMDLIRLGKKALLIPTPGQTEQAYLAKWLDAENLFKSCHQDDLKLENMIKTTLDESNRKIQLDFEGYKKALDDLGIQ